jgi:hypothetical protein
MKNGENVERALFLGCAMNIPPEHNSLYVKEVTKDELFKIKMVRFEKVCSFYRIFSLCSIL